MEKFYIVTDESEYRKAYLDYQQNSKDVNEIVKDFMINNEIETHEYAIGMRENYFAIVPTQKDYDVYGKQLKKDSRVGVLSSFKKNSSIFKELFKILEEKNMEVLHRPFIQFAFPCFGRGRSRIFEHKGIVYASYEHETDFENPKGFQEIKASDFYKVVEEIDK
ncbi:hypothetical protein AALB39_04030 [Lachnospiraceae bacterium 54-53]